MSANVERVALSHIRTDGGTQARASREEYAAAVPTDLSSHSRWTATRTDGDRMRIAFVDQNGEGWGARVMLTGGFVSETRFPVRESFVGIQLAALGFDPRGATWTRSELGKRSNNCSVYFAQSVAGGPIKIGFSKNPQLRVADLERGSPFPLRILKTTPGDAKTERALHDRFAAHRLRGEWFAPHPDLLAFIAEVS